MNIYSTITRKQKKRIAILIDPDKNDDGSLSVILEHCNRYQVDFIFAGGSLVIGNTNDTISFCKKHTKIPVIIFPGNVMQISDKADAILFLSLISGRNPEYLIGQHVIAAHALKKSGIEVIPTAYILIENGRTTSVEYISNTLPIPADKPEIVTATAIAGEMLGMKLVYLEAGSGAANSVSLGIIEKVRNSINLPLLIGGGIRKGEEASRIFSAGADVIVVGSAVEENPSIIEDLCKSR